MTDSPAISIRRNTNESTQNGDLHTLKRSLYPFPSPAAELGPRRDALSQGETHCENERRKAGSSYPHEEEFALADAEWDFDRNYVW